MIVSFGKSVYSDVNLKKDKNSVEQKTKKDNPNIKYTKAGNPYYKTNTGKMTGTVVGVVAGSVSPITALVSKNTKVALMSIPKSLIILAGCVITGSIFDGIMNHNERKRADNIKRLNVNA